MIAALIIISLGFYLTGFSDTQAVQETILGLGALVAIYVLIVRVSAEEIFFRGFLLNFVSKFSFKIKNKLIKQNALFIGVLISTAIFSFAHVGYGSLVELTGAFVLGMILAINFAKQKNLYAVILAHFLYNLFVFSITLMS